MTSRVLFDLLAKSPEAKRRHAGRLRKEDRDVDRFIKQLEMQGRADTRRVNRLLGPRRPPRRR